MSNFENHKLTILKEERGLTIMEFKEPKTNIFRMRLIIHDGRTFISGDCWNWVLGQEYDPRYREDNGIWRICELIDRGNKGDFKYIDDDAIEEDLDSLIENLKGYYFDGDSSTIDECVLDSVKEWGAHLNSNPLDYWSAMNEMPDFLDSYVSETEDYAAHNIGVRPVPEMSLISEAFKEINKQYKKEA